MAKIICVLYDDPVGGYPPAYARDALPQLLQLIDAGVIQQFGGLFQAEAEFPIGQNALQARKIIWTVSPVPCAAPGARV